MLSKYVVTKEGVIISKYRNLMKPMATHACDKGYHRVRLTLDNGTKRTLLVHRLVALKYLPNPNKLPQVNHIDGNKSNNAVDNLEWCDCQSNVNHSVRTGLVKRGKARPNAKLTDDQVRELRSLSKTMTYYQLADKFGIAYQTACKVCLRQTYTHID